MHALTNEEFTCLGSLDERRRKRKKRKRNQRRKSQRRDEIRDPRIPVYYLDVNGLTKD